ncbi:MAG: hypothetical protein JWM34_1593 [Ilumatobacteraceae bacterium]|nr:hypothetical protein [Ilumatobacteraceae bacterium]
MTFDERCRQWYCMLSDDLQAEAREVVGIMPDWMVVSLERADIPVIACEMTDGHVQHGYLMPTALMTFLDGVKTKPRTSEPAAVSNAVTTDRGIRRADDTTG